MPLETQELWEGLHHGQTPSNAFSRTSSILFANITRSFNTNLHESLVSRARLSTISRRQRLLGILRINKLLALSVASASVGIRDSRFDFLGQTTILGINFILFFSKDARGESWIHDGDGVDWSLFIVYGENYSQVQDFYDEIYGPPIYTTFMMTMIRLNMEFTMVRFKTTFLKLVFTRWKMCNLNMVKKLPRS
ncbi:hypothetical protein F2Q69_00024062 [Brassica cretica]|uniref:Uncharacterized protein n=1 Tax=Brassica cretica TaxID=69181 RepID=A0A8S9Q9S2_BRACR|nr:hypothetical protein F2Q69_00024062 [Brassica cretica]